MDPLEIGVLAVVAMVGLMALGTNIAFTFFVVGAAGTFFLVPTKAFLSTLATAPYFTVANYTLSTIPMFILMGFFASEGGITRDIFKIGIRYLPVFN